MSRPSIEVQYLDVLPSSPPPVDDFKREKVDLDETVNTPQSATSTLIGSARDVKRLMLSLKQAPLSLVSTRTRLDDAPPPADSQTSSRWDPHPLRPRFIIINVVLLILLGITLEVMFYANKRQYGWVPPAFFYGNSETLSIMLNIVPGAYSTISC